MSSSQSKIRSETIPCVRGGQQAAQLLCHNSFQHLHRKDSLISSSSYASSSSWQERYQQGKQTSFDEKEIALPSELPYLAKNGQLYETENCKNSWQSYIQSSEWEEGQKKGAFFSTLAQHNIIPNSLPTPVQHRREEEVYDGYESNSDCCSEVDSTMSGYSNGNVDDIVIWKKLEKALDTRFITKTQDHYYLSNPIPSSLQAGLSKLNQLSKSNRLPDRFSEPPKLPVPINLTPRPNTLVYQYQRITAAGSAAKQRRIYSGGQHK